MTGSVLGASRDQRIFRGWWVVTGVFVMLMTTSGLGFYGLAVYLRALTAEQGFSVGAVSGATAVFFIISGLVGLPVGAYAGRRDPRLLIAAGGLGGSLALLLLGRVEAVWQVYAVYALFGVSFAAAGLVPGTTIVTKWFSRRRSVALAVASTGLSAGGVVLTPLANSLIDSRGLPASAPILALLFGLGVIPASALLIRSSPEAVGLLPDGDSEPAPGESARVVSGVPAAEALRTRFYHAVTVAQLLALLAQVGAIAHIVNLVAERRDAQLGATAVSVLAISSLLGRLVGGWVTARTSMRAFAVGCMLAQGASLLWLAGAQSPVAILIAAAVFGATVGNVLMLHPLLLAERFGVRDYGRIYPRSNLVVTLGIAAGPAVIGLLYEGLGGYGAAFGLAAAASALGGAVLASSGPTRPAERAGGPRPARVGAVE